MFPTKNRGRLALFTIAFLVLSPSGADFASTGVPMEGEATYVLNGHPANLAEFPCVVALRLQNKDGTSGVCGGAILDASHIITAAHCLFTERGEENQIYETIKITITGGTLDSYTKDKFTKGFDIAIKKLLKPFDLSKPKLVRKTNILWTQTEAFGRRGTIAGWGVTLNAAGNDTTEESRYLQTAEVQSPGAVPWFRSGLLQHYRHILVPLLWYK